MPKPTIEPDAEAIAKLRHQKRWSQAELAKQAGSSKRTIERLESGLAASPTTLRKVAEALGVEPDTIALNAPLLSIALGSRLSTVLLDCTQRLAAKLSSASPQIAGAHSQLRVEYELALKDAATVLLEMLLTNIRASGCSDDELRKFSDSLTRFASDDAVGAELAELVADPRNPAYPSPEVLAERWEALHCSNLPTESRIWTSVAAAVRHRAMMPTFLSGPLRKLHTSNNLGELRRLLEARPSSRIEVRRDKYSQRMTTKYSPVDLANLMPAYAEDPGRMVIRDVFVLQDVRENPPPIEIPKDLAERLMKERHRAGDDDEAQHDQEQLEELRTRHVSQSPKPVLGVIAAADHRLLVLTGEPGSGKSTLMRHLLTGIIEPPVDRESREPLPWTRRFEGSFPLLIELRDFYALRRGNKCDGFLDYVDYMGKNDQWFLDQHAANAFLQDGPSLVMFDGLDEIFDTGDRERVMHEIAGFAQRYPRARIIVTSRPVGYKEQVLRDAGFAHFGIQDLSDEQIAKFVRGWFALTFPQQPREANQRIDRVLGSVRQSKPIRLLAGNPMLLTIMALLAREQELPRERANFYEKAVEVLCHHWDANRHLDLPEDRYLSADDKKDLLRRIAMRMQAGDGGLKGNMIREGDLEQEIQGFLMDEQWQPNAPEAKKAARRMIRQLRERNYILCLRGPRLYGFVHRTFLEYLTAAEYVRLFDRQPQQMTIDELIELFDQHCRDDEWREVLRLICGQINEEFVGRIVEHLATRTDLEKWNGATPLPELPLAVWCLSEVRSTARLGRAGELIWERCVEMHRRCGISSRARTRLGDLLAAANELGPRWPGQAHRLQTPQWGKRFGWGQMNWPRFLAARFRERDTIVAIVKDGSPWTRTGAIRALVETWPDDSTRKLLAERAVKDESRFLRRDALRALAEEWADDATRKLLEERAVKDDDDLLRRTALEALVEKWADDAMRKLLEERAVKDENGSIRRVALQALVEKWPDDATRKLLEERVGVDGAAASVLGGQHSEFGRIVLTRDLDGFDPCLDPAEPISREHIEEAAEQANVPPEEIDETVRSLSAHMGWDITKGRSG